MVDSYLLDGRCAHLRLLKASQQQCSQLNCLSFRCFFRLFFAFLLACLRTHWRGCVSFFPLCMQLHQISDSQGHSRAKAIGSYSACSAASWVSCVSAPTGPRLVLKIAFLRLLCPPHRPLPSLYSPKRTKMPSISR